MGYSIPGPDFTLPPMQVNVGAEIGKSIGNALLVRGQRKRQERKDAQKLKDTQSAFKNNLLIRQNELKTSFLQSVEKAGYLDTDKEDELFDQFKGVVNTKAQAALQARMAMEFQSDLSDEDRARYAGVVSDFENYSKTSMTQMGELVADIDSLHEDGMTVVGDPTNGEQLINTISLQNLSGSSAEIFGKGSISSRKLIEKNGKNIVQSIVKIPANSAYLSNVNTSTGKGGGAMIAGGLLSKKIKLQEIDGKEYYVFKNDINISNYSSKNGMDLVQQKIPIQDPSNVFKENKFLNDKDEWNTAFISAEPVVTTELEVDSSGKKTGYQKTVNFEIIDVDKMQNDPAYMVEMNSQYESVFNDPNTSMAQRQAYLLDIGSLANPKDLSKAEADKAKALVVGDMTTQIFSGYFKDQYKSTGSTPQNIQMQLGELKNGKFVGTDQQKLILEKAIAEGIKNPLTGELYQPGETIYLQRTEQSRVVGVQSTPTSKGSEKQVMFGRIYDALGEGDISGFTATQGTPGGKTFYKKFDDGVYEVDSDGEQIGAQPTDIEVLKSIYSIGTK